MLSKIDSDQEIHLVSSSKKSSLIGAFLIILALAVYMLFVRPLAETNANLQMDISSKDTELQQLNKQIADFENFQDELKLATEVQRLEVLKAVPAEMNQDEVIEDVIEIAETYDIELNSISFSKGSARQEGVKSLLVNASFVGNYLDLIDFLEGLEQNARVLKVNSITVQISKLDISDIERANFNLSIETFFQE